MAWLLNIIYAVLLAMLSPVIVWRIVRHGRYRRGLAEKLFGRISFARDERPVVWFHAVSVGEIIQLQKVVAEFRARTHDACHVLVTTSTDTGCDLARQRFDGCTVTWFPLDFSWAVRRALRGIQPACVVLMELELWPNFLGECDRKSIPVAVINARMSERSHRRYQNVRRWLAPMFGRLSLVAAQSDAAATRLRSLGVQQELIFVTGSIKFDGVATSRDNPATSELRELFQLASSETVLIAGSTQEPEEAMVLDAWQQLHTEHPNLRLILVPRHRERFDDVARLVESRGIPLLRRSRVNGGDTDDRGSAGTSPSRNPDCVLSHEYPVILLDTIGELSACWGLADIAFVGGSFGNRGGQNMIEPAAFGACVLFGPNTWNFRDVVQGFRDADACLQLQTPSDLKPAIARLLQDTVERTRLATAAQSVVRIQQGATRLTIERLLTLLPGAAPSAESRAA